MNERVQAMRIMAVLCAMATARLQGDAEGEAFLRSDVSSADAKLFGQAGAVVVADAVRRDAPLETIVSGDAPRVVAAARRVAAGDMQGAYSMVQHPTVSVEDTVGAVAASWLASTSDRDEAVLLGQRHCKAYRSMAEE